MFASQLKKMLDDFDPNEEVVVVFFALRDLHESFRPADKEPTNAPLKMSDEEWNKVVKTFWSNSTVQLILTKTVEKQIAYEKKVGG